MNAFDALTVGANFNSNRSNKNASVEKFFKTKKLSSSISSSMKPEQSSSSLLRKSVVSSSSSSLPIEFEANTTKESVFSSKNGVSQHTRSNELQARASNSLSIPHIANILNSSNDINSNANTSAENVLTLPNLSNELDIFDGFSDGDDDNDNDDDTNVLTYDQRAVKRTHSIEAKVSAEEVKKTCDNPLKPMTYKKIKHIWEKFKLHVTGIDAPSPIKHFSDLVRAPLNVPHSVVDNLFQRGHKLPTPIQMQAIPTLIHHRDVLACAPTGSGKTIAFLAPMFALLQHPRRDVGVRALIVTPTMELAQQIEREAFFLTKGQRWRMVQYGQSTRDKDFFVSTPGRVETLLRNKQLNLSHVEYLVFDEGDRLWDSRTDFLDVLNTIIHACSKSDKVVSLFTATLNEKIENAVRSIMVNDPVRIIVQGRQVANANVKQRLVFCGNELGKVVAIRNLIREGISPPVLIFVQSIERTKELYDEIRAHGLHLAMMNAKMSADERESVITNYRLGKIWVLITTELLSRGIDFKNVGTVINFDFPITVDAYIHRIGRTGRAGKDGLAITFFTEDDRERLPAIARVMRDSGNEVEDWMLEIKVDRKRRRQLEQTTPQRMIVSTRKRMLVAQLRTEREYKRLERDRVAKANAKRAKK